MTLTRLETSWHRAASHPRFVHIRKNIEGVFGHNLVFNPFIQRIMSKAEQGHTEWQNSTSEFSLPTCLRLSLAPDG